MDKKDKMNREVIAKPIGARTSRPQVLEKCGHDALNPSISEDYAITSRIILIGNGFDLAHGLKTSYKHFIDDFWERAFNDYKNNKGNKKSEHEYNKKPFVKISEEKGIEIGKGKFIIQEIDDYKNAIAYENKLLEKIERDIQVKNWCNIEKLYFDELVRCYKEYKLKDNRNDTNQIDKLNSDFEEIENELREYLKKEVSNNEGIKHESLILKDGTINLNFAAELQKNFVNEICNENITNYLFLTCNYTQTVELYKRKIKDKSKNVEIIYIHGELDSKIIFGYGDEFCDESKEIERLDENKFLRNVKQIKYAETPDYINFDKFITNDYYDVIILGHSCGNTDRTLLRRLLETGNCEKIIPYYYDNNDKLERQHNIYKIFENKQKFQKRITPVNDWKEIPCIKSINKSELDLMLENSFIIIKKPNKEKYKLLENNSEREIKQDFLIGKYQVTQQQWQDIMGSNPSYFQANGANKPVECVSWYDCIEFCNKLSEKYKLTKYYTINGNDVIINNNAKGFRLPTEVEWEYAARYYSRSDKKECKYYAGSTYNSNNDKDNESELANYAWFYENSNRTTHEVGNAKSSSELAIHDMSGNVWEWCEERCSWDSTISKILLDERGSYCVLRGGCWGDGARGCRVSRRGGYAPDGRDDDIGFRLALVP